MHLESTDQEGLSPETRAFYRRALGIIREARIPFLVGGAYALAHYAGIVRHTKDLDVFVRPADCGGALEALGAAGLRAELTFPHWLGKAGVTIRIDSTQAAFPQMRRSCASKQSRQGASHVGRRHAGPGPRLLRGGDRLHLRLRTALKF